ncbi:MAG: hypothetical protein ACT4OM_12605 [Actinomycetota bacterium]
MASLGLLLSGLSVQQREEIEELNRGLASDPSGELEIWLVYDRLRQLFPNLSGELGGVTSPDIEREQGLAASAGNLPTAVRAFQELGRLEQLERALRGGYAGAGWEDVDEEQLGRSLGTVVVGDLGRLRRIEGAAERLGLVSLTDSQLRLTRPGLRKLGERALLAAYEEVARRKGLRPTGSPIRDPWDPRWRGQQARPRRQPVTSSDLELLGAAPASSGTTVLLANMTGSGGSQPTITVRKAALALHALVATCLPRHRLYLVDLSPTPCTVEPDDLLSARAGDEPEEADLPGALALGRRLVEQAGSSGKDPARLALLATCLPEDPSPAGAAGIVYWPPVTPAVAAVRDQASKMSGSGAILDVYVLDQDPALERFARDLAVRGGGKVRAASCNLSADLLENFVSFP